MEMWDQEAVESLGPGFFDFNVKDSGRFRFICVEGDMDCRFTRNKKGRPLVHFTWSGFDEFDPTGGRGWAVVRDESLRGRIYFRHGDDSSFTAVRTTDAFDTRSRRPKRKWR